MRVKNATINSITAIFQKTIETILSFIYRTIFIQTIGITYLGVNGLFTNVFSIMSLAELGIGSSIIFLLYKPLYEKDNKKINQLMSFFSKTYKIIAISILVIGLLVIPFFPNFINETDLKIPNLTLIYLLLLFNTVSSYLFSYKRSLLEADQKAYYSNINISIFSIINTIVRIIILICLKNYILTLIASILITLISNIAITIVVNKLYPGLSKTKEKIDKLTFKEILKRIKAIMMHKIGNIVITSTDNIIISKYISLATVGIYSNYMLIYNIVYSTFSTIFISITASVGNLKVKDSNEKAENIFDKMMFLNFSLYFFSFVILYNVLNDFIYVWLGSDFLLSNTTIVLILISLYISGMRHVPVTFINSSGLNYNTRYKALIEAIINLIVSIILVKIIGINGVIIGTILCFLLCSVWLEPYILYKKWFYSSSKGYFLKYIFSFLFTIAISVFTKYLCSKLIIDCWWMLVAKTLIVFIIVLFIFVIFFNKNKSFIYYKQLLFNILNNNVINKFCNNKKK